MRSLARQRSGGARASDTRCRFRDSRCEPLFHWLSAHRMVLFFDEVDVESRRRSDASRGGAKKSCAKLLTQKKCIDSFRRNASNTRRVIRTNLHPHRAHNDLARTASVHGVRTGSLPRNAKVPFPGNTERGHQSHDGRVFPRAADRSLRNPTRATGAAGASGQPRRSRPGAAFATGCSNVLRNA